MKHTILVILFACSNIYLHAQTRLVTWGSDMNGTSGQGKIDFDLGLPAGPTMPKPTTSVTCFDDWQGIFSAGSISYCIRQDGSLWTWGVGYNTGLPESERDLYGGGNLSVQTVATQVGSDKNWKAVSGSSSTIGLKTDGTLWGWGLNYTGELGLGHTNNVITPQRIGTESNWKQVSVSEGYAMAIKTDGTLWAWGSGNVLTPSLISLQNDWVALSTGNAAVHAAIRRDGTLWIWGTNTIHNMLGMGVLFGTYFEPEPVQLTNDHDWKSVAIGSTFVIAQKTDGSLWGWGSNEEGQLGDGTFTDQSTPYPLGLGPGWAKVSAGADYVLALKDDHTIWGWGHDPSAIPSYGNTPVSLSNEPNWQDICVGAGLGMALQTGPHKPLPVQLELGSPINSCGATATITANIAGADRYKWYRPSGGPVAGGQTFTATTEGTYKLSVIKAGCRMTDQVTVTLNNINNTAFQASGTAIEACAGFFDVAQPVTFMSTDQTGGTVTWSFGNGVTSTEQAPQYTYPDRGHYTVTLTNNCGGSTTHDVGLATPLILADAAGSCGTPVTLATNITTADAYHWQTPAGTAATTPSITASAIGTYTATVTQGTCVQSAQVAVDLSQSTLQPEFTVVTAGIVLDEASTILRDVPLTIVGAGLNSAKSYTWALSDGTTSASRTFDHAFTTTGPATISLTATDNKGCTTTVDQHFHITDLTINDAISANADGMNDNLHFDPLPYTSTLKVTDQNGRTVFSASPYNDDFTGSGLPTGVYYYELRFNEIGKSYKGSVHVMK